MSAPTRFSRKELHDAMPVEPALRLPLFTARREPSRVPPLPVSEGVARILRQREDSIGSVQPPHPRSSTQSSGHFSDRIEARSDPGPGPDSLEPATWARRHSKVNSSGSDSSERG